MNIIARNRLLFSLSVCFMIVLVSISSVSGKNEINEQIVDDKILESSLLPSWLLLLVNGDWNYWDNQPNIYAISTGNVGIGTDDPNEKLTVAGIIESTSGGFKFPDGTIQTSASSGGGGESAWAWWSGTGISGDIYRIGNVGIGAITPTDKLDVDGGIRASYIRAQSNENLEFKTDEGATRLNITDNGDISANYNTVIRYYGYPNPDYDSGNRYMGVGEYFMELTHNLGGGSGAYYVVDLTMGNIESNNLRQSYFYRSWDPVAQNYKDVGYRWSHLNGNTITINRNYDETENCFRVRIWVYHG
jgi:hypothetical protein